MNLLGILRQTLLSSFESFISRLEISMLVRLILNLFILLINCTKLYFFFCTDFVVLQKRYLSASWLQIEWFQASKIARTPYKLTTRLKTFCFIIIHMETFAFS